MLATPSIRRALSLGIGLTAASSLIGACGGDDDEKQINIAKLSQGCSLNSQCENPLVCTFEHCHRQCDDDRDCRGEERCVKGTTGHVCQLPADTACRSAGDCQGEQVCGVDGECRDECTQDSDCTTGQVCAKSGECASTDKGKDSVDGNGNIQPDPFDDTKDGGGGAGGSSAGGSSGSGGSGGGSGSDGSGGVDGGPDSSVGGTAGMAGAGTGGTAGSTTDGGGDADAGCPTGTGECDGNPNTVCETDFSLSTSCGACTVSCNPQNGTVHCDAAAGYKCVVDSCTAGYDNCDTDGSNGCEARLSDNPNHCGRCGNSCGGGSCTTSNCGAATVLDPPGTGTYLYDIELTGNRIVASVYVGSSYEIRTATLPPTTPPSEGTVLHTFASGSERKDETFVTDATYVYWSTYSSPYTVYRKPLDNPSANIQNMFTAPTSGTILKLEATSTAFYYFGSGAAGYGFFTAAKTPGVSAQAISGLTGLYSGIGGFAIAGSRLFWAGYSSTDTQHQLLSAPAGGGAPQIADRTIENYSYSGVTSDGTYAYWTTYAQNGAIRRAAVATPTVVQDVALSVSYPKVGIVVDATYVYFMDNSSIVYRGKKDGSEAKQRIAGPTGTQYLTGIAAYDADFLYGPGSISGTVARISKNP